MDFWGWKDGKLIFHNQSMKSITRVLERKFNVDFVFKNKRIQDKIIMINNNRYNGMNFGYYLK